jgi:dTDP-4-amino-4,6-dideoxygalactose transaminase
VSPLARSDVAPLPFVDLAAQQARIRPAVDAAIARVLDHGVYVMGPEVDELEAQLAARAGVNHAVSCASGTDALVLSLMSMDVRPQDHVLVPAFTFAATAEAVALVGARPVFVDVRPGTFDIDPHALAEVLDAIDRRGDPRPVGVIPVDLFGMPADHGSIADIARREGLWVLTDAAQSFGAEVDGRPVGSLGDAATTSFFPAKPLGGYGDGGAVFTRSGEQAALLRSLRAHGEGADRYDNVRIGMTGRLDTIQAAILLQKLTIFDDELERRQQVAARYEEVLADLEPFVRVPDQPADRRSSWAQYTIEVDDRDGVARRLADDGIPTAVYYRRPLHRQPAYAPYPAPVGAPVADRLAQRVLSLPIHPYLDESSQARVVEALRRALHLPKRSS